MMKTSTRHLLFLIGGIFFALVGSAGIAAVAVYKPWGVPDSKMDRYYERLGDLREASERKRIAQETNAAKVRVLSSTIQNDNLMPGDVYHAKFVLENVGGQTLTLEPSEVSMPGVRIKYNDLSIPAQQSLEIPCSITVDKLETDVFDFEQHIKTNDIVQPEITLKLSGKAVPRYEFSKPIIKSTVRPGEPFRAEVVLYSRTEDQVIVTNHELSDTTFLLDVESVGAEELRELGAVSAVRLVVTRQPLRAGKRFREELELSVFNGEEIEQNLSIPIVGRIQQSVLFLGPNVHRNDGLDLGTIETSSDQQWSLVARFLGAEGPSKPAVLDIEPKGLVAKIEPIQKLPYSYRVTISVAENAKSSLFYGVPKSGYLEVGDQDDPSVSNWIPLKGNLVEPAGR